MHFFANTAYTEVVVFFNQLVVLRSMNKVISINLICTFFLVLSSHVTAADITAGEIRYKKTCINCHGPAGKGAASYPKISGNDPAYTTDKLETYRSGTEIGPNSGLMIMMAKPLTDEEISNLAAYLKDAKYEVNQ